MKHTSKWLGLILALSMLVVGAQAWAQDGLTGQEKSRSAASRAQAEETTRTTVEGLFNRLCPGRCELVTVAVQMSKPRAVGRVAPGFESIEGANFVSEPEAIDITVLLDSKLPANFRRNIPRMIQYRLVEVAPTVRVRPESLAFPEPQLEPLPPALPEPVQRQTPLPEPRPEPVIDEPIEDEVVEALPEPTLWQEIKPLLSEIAPWIGPMLMTLLLFAMVLALLNRLRGMQTSSTTSEKSAREESIDPEKLRAELMESRVLRNRVMRQWLEDDTESVAELVTIVGPDILDDLKADAESKARLNLVSELVRDVRELDSEALKQLARQLRNRIAAARVTLDESGLTRDWEFLEGLTVSALRRVLRPCTFEERIHVVGLLAGPIRSAYLETLNEDDRRSLFLGTRGDGLGRNDATALAARLRKAAEDLTHSGREAEGQAALVIEMLDALALDEQESMLRELKGQRPDVAEAVLNGIALETTALQAPDDVLADVVHTLSIDYLATFLRGTRADVRDRVIGMTSQSQRAAVTAELALDIPVGRAEYLEARTRFTRGLRDAMLREGMDLARVNSRVVMRTSINTVKSSEATS